MSRMLDLPIGTHPGWELEYDPEEEDKIVMHTIAESSVILQSLRQSREKWLTSTFPRFSAKSRGGRPPAIQPPPHTIKSHGRFDLSVGPHNFTHTAIYEVHYLPSTPQVPPPQASTAAQTHSQATITQPTALTGLAGQTATQPASIDATVTPTLISQVNAAAESNPILSRLLHTAAAGRATPDEIKTLSILIRSLGIGMEPSPPPPPLQGSAEPVNAVPPEPVKPFDIVIEFQERPSDRWILPRGLTSFEFIPYTSSVLSRGELVMTFGLPFPVNEQNAEKGPEPPLTPTPEPSRAVTMRWNGVPSSVYELALKWVGGEEISAQNLRTLEDLKKKTPKRSFLQYQLSDGPLLTQIQSAVAPPCPTKSIKPSHSDGSRPRRKPAAKKVTVEKPPPEKPAQPPSPRDSPPPPKRKKAPKPKIINPLPPISCRSCSQTDVPLMMGGRYCRSCIEQGKAVPDIPPAAPIKKPEPAPAPSITEFRPVLLPPQPRRISVLSMPTSRSPLGTNPPMIHPEGEKKD